MQRFLWEVQGTRVEDGEAEVPWKVCIKALCHGGQLRSVGTNSSKLREAVEDRGAWRAAVRGVAKRQTRLSDRTTVTTTFNPARNPVYTEA